jgi:hypothetical protein
LNGVSREVYRAYHSIFKAPMKPDVSQPDLTGAIR